MKKTFLDFLAYHKWLLVYTLLCVCLATIVILFGNTIGVRLFSFVSARQEAKLSVYLQQEGNYVMQNVSNLGSRDDIKNAIATRDVTSIKSILKDEQVRTGLTSFTVADENGIAITRALAHASVGDNVFLLTAGGRLAAKGVSGITIGSGRNFSLTMGGAYPIKDADSEIKGAVFGGYWFDNTYAEAFKKKYLSHWYHQEIVFYSKNDGVTGSSIDDVKVRNAMRAYITHGSLLVQERRPGELLNFGGRDYVISNHIFFEKDDVPGGALLLTELPLPLIWRSGTVAFIVAFIFFWSSFFLEHLSFPSAFRPRKKRLLLLLVGLALFVWFSLWAGIYTNGKRIITYIEKPAFAIYNSTMTIEPGSGIYVKGSPEQASVSVYSGGEEINAIEVHLRFDPALVSVDSLSFTRSVCQRGETLEQEINNTDGYVTISCVILGTAFSEPKGVVADINFTPHSTGDATFSFDEGTSVLAADGLGTNVLRSVTSAYYRIFNEEDMKDTFSPKAVAIPYSYTHENSAKWYSSKHINIVWSHIDGAEYLYELSDIATSTLINPVKTTSEHVTLDVPYDGVFYFRIVPIKNGVHGVVSSLVIQVDTTPPDTPVIRASNLRVKKGEVVRFELSSEDELSGLEKNYYVQNDDSIWLPTWPKLYVPFNDSGSHSFGVRVFDNAGNYSDAHVTVTVAN